MEEKMESEHSYSGESSSSSDSSSGSSEGDDEVMEPVRILGQSLELPQELCEDYSVFREFFSMKTWEALEDKHKEELSKFLPKFTENEEEETEKTIKMLFNHEPFHFTSPFDDFYSNLRQGNYRPDIAKMRKFLLKARAKQQKHKIKSYYAKLLPEVLISRERLLVAAKAAPPGPIPRLPTLPTKPSSKNNYKPLYLRARHRYFEELAAIRTEVGGEESDDDNYPEGPPEQSARKHKQNADGNVSGTLDVGNQSHLSSLECLKNVLAAHRTRRQYRENHPELNTSGVTLDDIKQRVALVNGAKKLMFGGQKSGLAIRKLKRGPKKHNLKQRETKAGIKKAKEELESVENKPLLPNIKIKCEQEESDSESSSFVDPVASPKSARKFDNVEVKQEVMDMKYPNSMSNVNYNDPKLDGIVKQEPPDTYMPIQNQSRMNQPVPIKLEDLDGIDMMALPVELADDSGEVIQVDANTDNATEPLVDVDESLTETTHANFMSLVRALFPARSAHRASKQQLHARCAAVIKSPIAPLNTWYNLSDDWCGELDSALDFLAGVRGPHPEDYVPYLQYIPETQMYQWIGAGRDCDAILGRLCERWLRAVSPPPPASEPPPPRYPTSWSVRPPTDAELSDFRAQERRRFSSAAKPFTYVQHGYRSVVGPCGRGGSFGGASSLLAAERPRHAVLPALVRDALARLPNGEGTRSHVLTLLKMSQWIAPCSDQALLNAVSSVLDRLISAKRDPMVKFDQRSAIWTYLHRHRSEEDWLRITSRSRGSKSNSLSLSLPSPSLVKTHSLSSAKDAHRTPPHVVDTEVANAEETVDNGSDSDVDVDDSGASSSVPQLSSAQLLMQVTQAKTTPTKGKKKPAPTQKTKSNTQKITSTKQASKQANLMTQSAKQATLLAQAVRQSNQVKQVIASRDKAQTIQSPKLSTVPAQASKPANVIAQTPKQTNLTAQTPKQPNPSSQTTKQSNIPTQSAKQSIASPQVKQVTTVIKQNVVKQNSGQIKQVTHTKPSTQSPKQTSVQTKQIIVNQVVNVSGPLSQANPQLSKSLPSIVTPPTKSPLIKQRPLQKVDVSQIPVSVPSHPTTQAPSLVQTSTISVQMQNKMAQGTRSLLIRPAAVQTTATAGVTMPTSQSSQLTPTTRRGVVRVLSPATPSSGKSLISPRALMQQATPTAKKRTTVANTPSVTTIAQSTASATTVVSTVPAAVTSSMTTRTVQLATGRTVQLANQTVHLPGGQAVQLTSGHTLQLSSLQLPTHSVRLPSGQTVQLASPQSVQAVRVSTTAVRNPSPRALQTTPTIKAIQTSQPTVQIPVSSVQLAGQTVQIAGQTVQLTGHTVKLPSGQSVQVASQSVLPSQSVQLPSGQTVQLASGNVQTVQLGGSNVQLSGQSVQMPSGQTVQLGSQTVQLSGQTMQLAGQTVQLPSGQTLQLPGGQTVQLSSGQTIQLASGQTVQLANHAAKAIPQVVRTQTPGDKSASQPIVAKLLTNAQGQMISLEGMVPGARALQLAGARARGVRVLPPAGAARVLPPAAGAARLARPLLLTSAKPLHNIILQQSDGSAIRMTSSGAAATSQTLVLGNIGAQAVTTPTTSTPVLKLQQVNPIQQVKLAQGLKIHQAVPSATSPSPSGVRSVLMDGQQLKLVGGRHVLARILRPAHPPQ